MMKIGFLFLFTLFSFGCAEKSVAPDSKVLGNVVNTPLKEEQSSPTQAESQDESSDSALVQRANKCPKHSKVIKGKCTLQVESDD